jgi:hypothetical protein
MTRSHHLPPKFWNNERPETWVNLVEPMGFEPTAFPVSPGRAHQALNEPAIFLLFDVRLPPHRFATCLEFLHVEQLPRPTILVCLRVVQLVILKSLFQMLGLSDVKSPARFTLEDVDMESHRTFWWSRWDSNPRPPRCHRGALPTAPRPHRFELTAFPVSPGRAPNCATAPPFRTNSLPGFTGARSQLRHGPTVSN